MFGTIYWPLNVSRGLSASAEFLDNQNDSYIYAAPIIHDPLLSLAYTISDVNASLGWVDYPHTFIYFVPCLPGLAKRDD